ncbi:MAG: copper chaperone PCu(A)C [Pseudomonas sp.]|uniref:copper chaperone PCu(A)C n=1 Tax=Pseudomonas sp. TaxID=306 RepID=UPI003D0B6C85
MFKNALMLAALLLPASFANAHEYTLGNLHIAHPWSLELPPNAPNVAAYFVIDNNGKEADRLLSASTTVSDRAELHQHVMNGDVMRMQQVPDVAVPAGGKVTFSPSAYHVMIMAPKDRSLLTDGKHFPLTLRFEKAGEITVDVAVQKQPPAGSDEHQHQH